MTPKQQETDDLIERLEKASGQDRELDRDIESIIIGIRHPYPSNATPHYTASIDAALMLVPEGYRVGFEHAGIHDGVYLPEAWCWPFESDFEPDWRNGDEGYRSNPEGFRTVGATPAIAICIAALRSRAMTDEGRG